MQLQALILVYVCRMVLLKILLLLQAEGWNFDVTYYGMLNIWLKDFEDPNSFEQRTGFSTQLFKAFIKTDLDCI